MHPGDMTEGYLFDFNAAMILWNVHDVYIQMSEI